MRGTEKTMENTARLSAGTAMGSTVLTSSGSAVTCVSDGTMASVSRSPLLKPIPSSSTSVPVAAPPRNPGSEKKNRIMAWVFKA